MPETLPKDSFICSSCGLEHLGLPFSFAADFPDPYANLTLDQRETRAIAGSDQCMIDQQDFYIRGCLEIPIVGTDQIFLWGLWAKLKEEDFDEISDHWEFQGREELIGPYKGRLANSLSIYPDTLNQLLEVQVRPVGSRPLFTLEQTGNVLAIEQHSGMASQKASEYSCLLMRIAGA